MRMESPFPGRLPPKGFCIPPPLDNLHSMLLVKAHDFSGYRQFTASLWRLADESSWDVQRSRAVAAPEFTEPQHRP